MTYRFHLDAKTEYTDAILYYESCRPGLGAAFTLEVEAAIQRILEAPTRWRTIEKDVRTCRTRTFPYALLYTMRGDTIFIVAVMHLHRKPGYWRERI